MGLSRLGTFALVVALGLAIYGLIASILGARRRDALLAESARSTCFSLLALVAAANGAMLAAILTNDFAIRYVAENSSRATPTFFKVLSLWSADEGSLLLWNLILAGFISAVAFRFRKRRPETLPAAMAVLFAVQCFYLVLVLGPTRPFATLAAPPLDGQGPLPLLQNHPLMAAHPPFLYLGFIGMTVPFAFAVAALAHGTLSDRWIRLTRRWALAAWIFLTIGLVLGALWSYGVLGWGGYWAWDPVENVALLPWLVTTAFLHSVVIQERRGMLKVWNLSLVVGAFALTTFGTFLTRGSILSSVHSFARSAVGPMYLGFLVLVLLVGFGLIAAQSWRLRSEGRFDSALSRETTFLGNNLVLVAVTFIVLIGTIFPLVVEAISDRQVTVGGPYFKESTVPLFLALLLLMGVGPLMPWRRATGRQVRERLALPAAAGATVMVRKRGESLAPENDLISRRGGQHRGDRQGRQDLCPGDRTLAHPFGPDRRGPEPAALRRSRCPRRDRRRGGGDHGVERLRPPGRGRVVPWTERAFRRLHAHVPRRASGAPAATVRLHRGDRGHEGWPFLRRPPSVGQRVSVGSERSHRHAVDPLRRVPRPVRDRPRLRSRRRIRGAPVLPQPRGDLGVGGRRDRGVRRPGGRLADPASAGRRPTGGTSRAGGRSVGRSGPGRTSRRFID